MTFRGCVAAVLLGALYGLDEVLARLMVHLDVTGVLLANSPSSLGAAIMSFAYLVVHLCCAWLGPGLVILAAAWVIGGITEREALAS